MNKSRSNNPADEIISSDAGVLDTLLASSSPAKSNQQRAKSGSAALSADLDELLSPDTSRFSSRSTMDAPPQRFSAGGTSPPPPQRFSGGGTVAPPQRSPNGGGGDRGGGWDSPDQSQSRAPPGAQSSFGSSFAAYADDFGSVRGAFASDVNAAQEKAVKGDRSITHVDVDDEGACPVSDKDIDERTVKLLAGRGITVFTPVQVGFTFSLCWTKSVGGLSSAVLYSTIRFLDVVQVVRFAVTLCNTCPVLLVRSTRACLSK